MSEIRTIIESKLKRLRIERDKFIEVGNKTAIEQRNHEIHILEDVLEDASEANGVDTSQDQALNLAGVSVSF